MKLLDIIQKRCSIRQYSPTPVEKEKVEYILEAARLAPSAVNYQPWYFLVIEEEENRKKVVECYPREWIRTAPLFIVVCGDHDQSWKRASDRKDHLDIDAGIVTEHICLAATEEGLGTCIVCNFDVPLFRNYFRLPEQIEPLAIIPIGYPTSPDLFTKTPKKWKPLAETVRKETY
ncbi:MAG: nitroreductase family protein [Tannerellaceae bacterium]|nr:nitroreductase family protein [Tannerellaceae bacterium]